MRTPESKPYTITHNQRIRHNLLRGVMLTAVLAASGCAPPAKNNTTTDEQGSHNIVAAYEVEHDNSLAVFQRSVRQNIPPEGAYREVIENNQIVYEPAQEIPTELQSRFDEVKRIVNGFLPPDKQVSGVHVYTYNTNVNQVNGTVSGNAIEIYAMPYVELPIHNLEVAAFHEGMHLIDFSGDTLRSTALAQQASQLTDNRNEHIGPAAIDFRIMKGTTASEAEVVFDRLSEEPPILYSYLDESSYGVTGGHPYDNPEELFASTATVLRYFGPEFVQSTSPLLIPERGLLWDTARGTIDIVADQSNGLITLEEMFGEEILRTIGR